MATGKIFEDRIIVYTDGGARGNPGPAAIGVVVGGKEYGEYLGIKTNNQAEYLAVIFALHKVKQLIGKRKTKQAEIEIRMDSELLVKQLNGQYKIKEAELRDFFIDVWNLRIDFKNVKFIHIPRTENKLADRIMNETLDRNVR